MLDLGLDRRFDLLGRDTDCSTTITSRVLSLMSRRAPMRSATLAPSRVRTTLAVVPKCMTASVATGVVERLFSPDQLIRHMKLAVVLTNGSIHRNPSTDLHSKSSSGTVFHIKAIANEQFDIWQGK